MRSQIKEAVSRKAKVACLIVAISKACTCLRAKPSFALPFALPFALTSVARQRPYKTQFCMRFGIGKRQGKRRLVMTKNVILREAFVPKDLKNQMSGTLDLIEPPRK